MKMSKLTCDLCQASYTMKHDLKKHLNTHVIHLKEQQIVFSEVNSYLSIMNIITFTCDLCKDF